MDSRLVNGVRVFAPPSRRALIDYALAHGSLLVAVNAEKILHATNQSRQIINDNVGYPDGIGAVLGLRKKGIVGVEKIPGCELWLDIVREHFRSKSFYIVGSTDEVVSRAVTRLRQEFLGIQIVGCRNGYLNEVEEDALIDDLVLRSPDVVFVAMGSPRQEQLMMEMRKAHKALYQGLGGSLDIYAGKLRRAPAWWIDHHLEWFYRLLQQPSRFWRQVHLVRFLWKLYAGHY